MAPFLSHSIQQSQSSRSFVSVLGIGFRLKALKASIATRVQKVLPKATSEEIHELSASLVRFLELKIILQEYSPDSSKHLLVATGLLEQAWLALYEDYKVYSQVIAAIQDFHRQPKCHVFLRRTCPGLIDNGNNAFTTMALSNDEYLARLTRTQSLMQCYYQITLPNSLRELQHQTTIIPRTLLLEQDFPNKADNISPETKNKTKERKQDTVVDTLRVAVPANQSIVYFDHQSPIYSSLSAPEMDHKKGEQQPLQFTMVDDTPSEVVPENGYECSYSYSSTEYSSEYSETEEDDGDSISFSSSYTNSTGLASSSNPFNPFCQLLTLVWNSKQIPVHSSARARKNKPQQQEEHLLQDDLTISVTDSEDSSSKNTSPKRRKKRYQKLNQRLEEFMCYWV